MTDATWPDSLLSLAASDSIVALGLAGLAALSSRLFKNPSVAHCLWVLVLIKLVTPPLFEVAIPMPAPIAAFEPASFGNSLESLFTDPVEAPRPASVARRIAEPETDTRAH